MNLLARSDIYRILVVFTTSKIKIYFVSQSTNLLELLNTIYGIYIRRQYCLMLIIQKKNYVNTYPISSHCRVNKFSAAAELYLLTQVTLPSNSIRLHEGKYSRKFSLAFPFFTSFFYYNVP